MQEENFDERHQAPISELLIPVDMLNETRKVQLLCDLVFHLIGSKDLNKIVAEAHAERSSEYSKLFMSLHKKQHEDTKKLETPNESHKRIVAQAFRDTHRLRFGGENHNFDEVLQIETLPRGSGAVEWRLEDEIINREEEFKGNYEATKEYVRDRYVGFNFTKHLQTKDGHGTFAVDCMYVN